MTIQQIISDLNTFTVDEVDALNALLDHDLEYETDNTTPGACNAVEDVADAINGLSEEDREQLIEDSIPEPYFIGTHPPAAPKAGA